MVEPVFPKMEEVEVRLMLKNCKNFSRKFTMCREILPWQ